MEALVFDIEKFAVHDGPGIRTVVFIKGCPLRCVWCHNPESQSFKTELFFTPEKCIGCGWCVSACQQKCHLIQDGRHLFDREKCVACGRCASKCYAEALEVVGKRMSVEEVMKSVLADKLFYDNSNGGVTLSGGEPMANIEFTYELLKASKTAGLHTCIETCGFAPPDNVHALLPLVDLWLWDVKATPEMHKRLTGVEFQLILDNLRMIDEEGAKMWLRCPLVHGVNDSNEHLLQIAKLASSLHGCERIDIEPYHPLGEGKAQRLGRSDIFHAEFTSKEIVKEYESILKAHTSVQVYSPQQ